MSELLNPLRKKIDVIDAELVKLLAERAEIVMQVADIKAEHGLPAFIPERVEEVITQVRGLAEAQGMEPELAERVWRAMIGWFIEFEEKHLGG